MTDETPDLILEQFRILRADIAGVRSELASHREETRHDFTALGNVSTISKRRFAGSIMWNRFNRIVARRSQRTHTNRPRT
ncbi:MAG: hypothetical protein ACREDH_16290 [Methylocella sp.]